MHNLFTTKQLPTAVTSNCTMAVIKPSAVRAGLTGKIIAAIAEKGFHIAAAEMFYLDRPSAVMMFT
jgi:nucleoside diphosphate kinase